MSKTGIYAKLYLEQNQEAFLWEAQAQMKNKEDLRRNQSEDTGWMQLGEDTIP